jgi:signal transduction histidine kinase
MTLNNRLTLLAAAATMPLIVSLFGFEVFTYRHDVIQETARAKAVARSVVMLVECEIEIRSTAMEVLATSGSLRNGDLPAFRERALEVIRDRFPHSAVVLLRQDGQQLVNTHYPLGAELPIRSENRESLDLVFATGRPAVSDLFQRQGESIIAVDVPVIEEGRVTHVLSLNPQISMLDTVLRAQMLPKTWVISVFDRTGTNVSRLPNGDEFRGRKASNTLYAPMLAQAEGDIPTTSLEGIPLMTAWVRGPLFGWSVAVGVPRAELTAPAWRMALMATLIGAWMATFSIRLALYVARKISEPILRLTRLAVTPDLEWQPTQLPEVNEVARALIEAESNRKAREKRMREMQSELIHVARLSTIGQMTSAISHELMQPLTAAQSYLGALIRMQIDGRLLDTAMKAREQIRRAGDVVHKLRNLAARRPVTRIYDDLNEVVEEALRIALIGLPPNVETRLDFAPDLPPAPIDRVLIEQVVINLARNAIEAMATSETRRLTLRTSRRDDGVEICVADTGPGFASEVTDNLFQPFVTTKPSGLGLGLSICRDLIDAHGGTIRVESSETGATVKVYLPVQVQVDA